MNTKEDLQIILDHINEILLGNDVKDIAPLLAIKEYYENILDKLEGV